MKSNENMNQETVGKLLRDAREKSRLSQSQVADELRLRVHIIDDLENDFYDNMANLAFTKGYIRSYAKFLGLDSAPLISTIDPEPSKSDTQEKEASESSDTTTKVESSIKANIKRELMKIKSPILIQGAFKKASILLMLAFIMLIGLWWYGHSQIQKLRMGIGPVIIQPSEDESVNNNLNKSQGNSKENSTKPQEGSTIKNELPPSSQLDDRKIENRKFGNTVEKNKYSQLTEDF